MIAKLIRSYIIMVLVLFITDWLMPNVSFGYPVGKAFTTVAFLSQLPVLLIAALVLTLLSIFARPILKIISAPINFITLGAFNVVINVFLFWLATYLVDGFTITALNVAGFQLNTFFSYVTVAVIFGFTQGLLALVF